MSHGSDVLPLDDASVVWKELSERVERFVAAWEAEPPEPPSVAEFLKSTKPNSERLTAVELIKVDLEYRWLRRKQPRRLEDYLAEFPFLAADPPVDLIYEECHIRRRAGETFDPEEPCRRFPAQADALRRLMGAGQAMQSTILRQPAATKTARLEPGERIDDFDLLTKLGEGAFGAVFLARQISMQRIVALKASADRGSEGQTLAQLDHEHIVRVYDQRVVPERGLRLMYMQYAAGGTLEDALKRLKRKPLEGRTGRDYLAAVDAVLADRGETPPSESPLRARLAAMRWPEVICWLGARLARALDYAHHVGVLHRDLKPANILITAEGSPKLADFNVSYSNKVEGATPAAYFGGSLAYMSPEQLEACSPAHDRKPEDLDGRSDLYSLGVVLWELLIGMRPFEDEQVERSWALTLEQMVNRRKRGPRLSEIAMLVRDAAPGLDRVLATALEADVSKRINSGGALSGQLELCLHPRAQRLLAVGGNRRSWIDYIPVLLILTLTLIPNGLAGAFNYVYNKAEIIDHLGAGADHVFERTQTTINLLLFPLGVGIGAYRARRFSRYLKTPERNGIFGDVSGAELRRRCLMIGHEAAILGISLWCLAGAVYPTVMHWGLGQVPMMIYVHFFSSLLLCGLIAAAYPFFLVTLLGVRRFYPRFVRLEWLGPTDQVDLERLRVLSWAYLGVAALVPMLGGLGMALNFTDSQAKHFMQITAGVGIIGFIGSLTILLLLHGDIDALLPLTHDSKPRAPQSLE